MRGYLLGLRERGAALGTFKSYHGGIQFLYRRTLDCDWALFEKKRIRPPKQLRLPEVLSAEQVRALLGGVRNPVHRACFALMYACGLRISEAPLRRSRSVQRSRPCENSQSARNRSIRLRILASN